jgi:replication fork protection complex subunit Tof1/Swi1
MIYLEGYKTFTDPEQMKRIVSLMHRQAIKAKNEGLFYKVRPLPPLSLTLY